MEGLGCWRGPDEVKAEMEFQEDEVGEIRRDPLGHIGSGGHRGGARTAGRAGACHRDTLGPKEGHLVELEDHQDDDDEEEAGSVGEEGKESDEAGSWDSCQAKAAESNAICRPRRVDG